jgi:hypothetical protein
MYQPLLDVLEPTMLAVCRSSLEKHAGEHFYGVALYTSGEYNYLVDSIATTEGLGWVARKYLQDKYYQENWGTLEVAARELKWSPCDSPLHCEFDGMFAAAQDVLDAIWKAVDRDSDDIYMKTCELIHDTCIAVMTKVRASGLFDEDQVLFNLLMGDQSNEERLLNAEALNSESVLARFRSELVIDDEQLENLRVNRWHM